MKITIVMGAFLPVPPVMGGAVEKVWFTLAQEFARRGHTVVQISRALPPFPLIERIEGVHHIRVPGHDTPASLLSLKALDLLYSIRAKRALPPSDIIVTNTFWLPFLLRNSERGRLYVHVARFPKGQMRFYSHAARLQAPSSAIAEAIIAELPRARTKTKVIPYPRPDAASSELPPSAGRARTILYVGREHPEKGIHLLVNAFVMLPARLREEWRLVIVGSAETRFGGGGADYRTQLEHAAAAAMERIEFRGPIFDAIELEREYRNARLFVYPSLAETGETFGLAPLEAMAHGCAVLVSDLRCFRDFVHDEATGFVFDHRAADPARTLREKIAQILEDEASLKRIAETGRQASDEYSLARIAGQFLADFASLRRES